MKVDYKQICALSDASSAKLMKKGNSSVKGAQHSVLHFRLLSDVKIERSWQGKYFPVDNILWALQYSMIDESVCIDEILEEEVEELKDQSDGRLDLSRELEDQMGSNPIIRLASGDYSLYVNIVTIIRGNYTYDSWSGYDWDAIGGWVDKYDKGKLLEALKDIDIIGEVIDKSSVEFILGDVEESDKVEEDQVDSKEEAYYSRLMGDWEEFQKEALERLEKEKEDR